MTTTVSQEALPLPIPMLSLCCPLHCCLRCDELNNILTRLGSVHVNGSHFAQLQICPPQQLSMEEEDSSPLLQTNERTKVTTHAHDPCSHV